MNLLSRRSVLAIAAVVDVALHSRSARLRPKLWLRVTNCLPGTWRRCSRGWSTPKFLRACADREAATSWRASADASLWARSCARRCR